MWKGFILCWCSWGQISRYNITLKYIVTLKVHLANARLSRTFQETKYTNYINYIPLGITPLYHGNLNNHPVLHPCKWHNLDGTWYTCPGPDGGNGPHDRRSHTGALEGPCASPCTVGRGRGCCSWGQVHMPHTTCDKLGRRYIVNNMCILILKWNSWINYVTSGHWKL